MRDLSDALEAIDQANGDDPSTLDGQPLAQLQGQRASHWLSKLHPDASDELHLAARAHHLRRWEIARSDYPTGRAGYLRWRKDNKAHQADAAGEILTSHGWSAASIDRTRKLLLRTALHTDPETQALEDVACLVFVETQFGPMVERLDHDHMVRVVSKTLNKMSSSAVALAAQQPLSPAGQSVLAEATTTPRPRTVRPGPSVLEQCSAREQSPSVPSL